MTKRVSSRNGNWISFAIVFFLLASSYSYGQEFYARALYTKVEPQNIEQYLKIIRENVKPLLQQAKKNGEITDWALYQIHNTGTSDEYNFCSVLYYDSWAKTEKLQNLDALAKQVNSKSAQPSLYAPLNNIRKIVKNELYRRIDGVSGPGTSKFFQLDFMKVQQGMGAEYVTVEKEIWTKIHKELISAGSLNGWTFWGIIYPNGTSYPYQFATANGYVDYAKLNQVDMMAAIKKAHADKSVEDIIARTFKSREIVRSELWEQIEITDPIKVASN